jgi:hypothetical protein
MNIKTYYFDIESGEYLGEGDSSSLVDGATDIKPNTILDKWDGEKWITLEPEPEPEPEPVTSVEYLP